MRGMIDENGRKTREQKVLCEGLGKVWAITLRWSASGCEDYLETVLSIVQCAPSLCWQTEMEQ